MAAEDLKRVREHIEAILLGRSSLTAIEVKGADGDLRGALAGLQVLAKQLEQRTNALSAREAYFANLVRAAKIAIWECDVEGVRGMLEMPGTLKRLDSEAELVRILAERLRITSANQEALEMFGAANREMLDACLEELVRDEGAALFRSLFRAIARRDTSAKLEGTVYRIGQGELHVVVALIADPNTSAATLVWTDLTGHQERVQAEQSAKQQSKELERVNKDVERLFRAVSHDLRAPLRAVLNLVEWALEDIDAGNAEEVPRHLHALKGRVSRLERMLTDLLSYARLGRAEHAYESVEVGGLLEEVRDMVDLPEGFAVTWPDSLPTVVTQRTLMSQVFLNLISNAVKHHDGSSGTIDIQAEDQDSFIEFRVRDDGPGIPPQQRNKIFGLFTTLKRRDEVEGSGMGLAFVQKVVKQLGGNIEAVGPEGRGITFAFTWPKGPTARKQKKSRPPTLVGFKFGETVGETD